MSTAANPSILRRLGWIEGLVATLLFAGIASFVYEPALRGPLLSDDYLHFGNAPWMEDLDARNVLTILDPRGEPVLRTANWAPVHLLAHLAEHEIFGSYAENTYPYHLVNVIVHGLNATLLAALMMVHGVPLAAALLGALVFLLHPANVEAVAWIFQLKTLLSFSFAFAALLCLARRPAASTLFFVLAILAKPSAAAALAAAIVFEWLRQPVPGEPPRRTRWLFAWGGLLALYALVEIGAFRGTGEYQTAAPLSERALQVVAIVGRYLVIATSSLGASAFHQPARPSSLLDPWFLLGLATLIGLAFVCARALARRHVAAGWLGLAAASYVPVAQIFPFPYPMADRYLYFVLAGLLGALLVTLAPRLGASLASLRERGIAGARTAALGAALGVALSAGYAFHAHARATVWRSADALEQDSATNYPDGVTGQIVRARHALSAGDFEAAVDAIEAAQRLGHDNAMAFLSDPTLQALRGYPRYEALLQDMARRWIDQWERLPDKVPGFGVVDLVIYHLLLGEPEKARERLAEAEAAGPDAIAPHLARQLRVNIEQVEAALGPAG